MKVAFILGAGAHKPFGFPLGNELKRQVINELKAQILDLNNKSPHLPLIAQLGEAHNALADCGVSIDRFLWERKSLGGVVRPLIAKCLLAWEFNAASIGMGDWLEYTWQAMAQKHDMNLAARFVFITFNYDRTLEYRLAHALMGLWGLSWADALDEIRALNIYHIYGSFGDLGPSDTYLIYGQQDHYQEAGSRIKIIGEGDATTTEQIHERLKNDVELIFVLGCAYHRENMKLLSLDTLPNLSQMRVFGSCFDLTGVERQHVADQYGYLSLSGETMTALDVLRNNILFQKLRP